MKYLKKMEEELKKILLSEESLKELADSWNRFHRLKRNRMMYDIFTPFYIKIWHRIMKIKPYTELDYNPKF